MMDAAAIDAETRSPFHTARPGAPSPSTPNPSVRTYAGRPASRAIARRRARTSAASPAWGGPPAPPGQPGEPPAQRLDVGDVHAEPVALRGRDDDHRPRERPG